MVRIGRDCGKRMDAVITKWISLWATRSATLWRSGGAGTAQGGGPTDLRELCLDLAARMLVLSELGDYAACRGLAARTLDSGRGAGEIRMLIEAQGGDGEPLENPARLPAARYRVTDPAKAPGKRREWTGLEIGRAAVPAGCRGRLQLEWSRWIRPRASDVAKPWDVLECGTRLWRSAAPTGRMRMAGRFTRGAPAHRVDEDADRCRGRGEP